jgi:hypothetical protein
MKSKPKTFKEAVDQTPTLAGAYCEGLQALRKQDARHIEAEDTRSIKGSVDVDTANLQAEPHANRWDFGISYKHTNRSEEVIYWVEMHTAIDSEVSRVLRKAEWLQKCFKGKGKLLAAFEKDIFWVSSGATSFTLTSPQLKQMAQLGLRSAGNKLRIRNHRSRTEGS